MSVLESLLFWQLGGGVGDQSINQIRFYYQPTTTARLRGGGGTGAQNIRVEYVLRCCLLMKASQLTRSQFPKSTYVTLQC